jgi:hypothetical protein
MPTAAKSATPSRRARRQQERRRRRATGAAIIAAVALAGGAVAWAGTGSDDHGSAAKVATRQAPAGARARVTTTSTTADGARTTTTTTTTLVPGAAAGTPGNTSAPVASTPSPSVAVDDAPTLDLTAKIVQGSGACRYDADAGELVDSGTVTNPSGDDALVEIDVTFTDATGELDSASDVEQVGPGETVEWEASTLAFDPPSGALSCQVSQS